LHEKQRIVEATRKNVMYFFIKKVEEKDFLVEI